MANIIWVPVPTLVSFFFFKYERKQVRQKKKDWKQELNLV